MTATTTRKEHQLKNQNKRVREGKGIPPNIPLLCPPSHMSIAQRLQFLSQSSPPYVPSSAFLTPFGGRISEIELLTPSFTPHSLPDLNGHQRQTLQYSFVPLCPGQLHQYPQSPSFTARRILFFIYSPLFYWSPIEP